MAGFHAPRSFFEFCLVCRHSLFFCNFAFLRFSLPCVAPEAIEEQDPFRTVIPHNSGEGGFPDPPAFFFVPMTFGPSFHTRKLIGKPYVELCDLSHGDLSLVPSLRNAYSFSFSLIPPLFVLFCDGAGLRRAQ